MIAGIHLKTQTNLLQIVSTVNTTCALTGLCNRRKQQGSQNTDDRDDHQELNEGKTPNLHVSQPCLHPTTSLLSRYRYNLSTPPK